VSDSTRWGVPQPPKVLLRAGSVVVAALSFANAYELNAEPAAYAVTGTSATTVVGKAVTADPGTYAVTGTEAATVAGKAVSADPGAYTVTGTDAAVVRGLVVSADPGGYAVSGVEATLEYIALAPARNTAIRATRAHSPPGPRQVSQTVQALAAAPASEYSIDAQPGAYVVTGVDATLLGATAPQDKILAANRAHTTPQIVFGSRIFGGVSEPLSAYELNASPGTYAVTGTDATVVRGLVVSAVLGVYTTTGTAATTVRGLAINAVPGVYTVTGFDADLVPLVPGAFVIAADPGVYTLTGTAATTVSTRFVTADPGAYVVTGTAASTVRGKVVSADPGVYAVTGTSTGHLLTRVLGGDPGVYLITGAPTTNPPPPVEVPIEAGWISSGRVRVLTRGRQGRIDQPETGEVV
jgi:hypothetical protein